MWFLKLFKKKGEGGVNFQEIVIHGEYFKVIGNEKACFLFVFPFPCGSQKGMKILPFVFFKTCLFKFRKLIIHSQDYEEFEEFLILSFSEVTKSDLSLTFPVVENEVLTTIYFFIFQHNLMKSSSSWGGRSQYCGLRTIGKQIY